MPILTDTHIHSTFSSDGKSTIPEHCESAISKGFTHICITDHLEFNPLDGGYGFLTDHGKYFDAIERARDTYGGRLTLLSGCEVGGGPHNFPREYEECLARPYDFVLCSVHDWYQGLFASDMATDPMPIPLEESYDVYWDEVYKTVTYGGFDSLAHIDFPKRYYGSVIYDWDKLAQIFEVMTKNDIALEINTSSLRKGRANEAMPGKELLTFYKKCGGRMLTVGSDAHVSSDIGAGFPEIEPLTKGFDLLRYRGRNRENMQLTYH